MAEPCGLCGEDKAMHYLLLYETADDYIERRESFRALHLKLAWEAQRRGELVLGGALLEPTDGAVLLFEGESPEAAERFAQHDPYVLNGLITHWKVRPWMTVVGTDATRPTKPGEAQA